MLEGPQAHVRRRIRPDTVSRPNKQCCGAGAGAGAARSQNFRPELEPELESRYEVSALGLAPGHTEVVYEIIIHIE